MKTWTKALACAVIACGVSSVQQAATVTESFKLMPNLPNGAQGDRFGFSVAASYDTVVVGSPLSFEGVFTEAGSAYVYTLQSAFPPIWSQQAKLESDVPWLTQVFGWSVSVSGNTIAVGAPLEDATFFPEDADTGSVYVYHRSGVSWTLQQKLGASNPTDHALFGSSVSVDGTTLAVGVRGANGNTGAVYLFELIGSTWTQKAILVGADSVVGDQFGGSVSLSGDRLVVGADRADLAAPLRPDAGAAYAFARSSTGVWTQKAKLLPTSSLRDDNFGTSVSVSGNTIACGQPFLGVGANANIKLGAVSVFVETEGVWSLQRTLMAADGVDDDYFGRSVAINGDELAVGAYYKNVGEPGAGAGYLFRRTNTSWNQVSRYQALVPGRINEFGVSAAIASGNTVFGALLNSNITGNEAGAAYVFTRTDGSETSLAVSQRNPPSGNSIVLTASVRTADGAAPTGSVQFFANAQLLGTVPVNGLSEAQLVVIPPGGIDLAVSARYGGNGTHIASSSPLYSVTAAAATTTADLSITKSNGVDFIQSGGKTTYSIIARNNGPNAVIGAVVSDNVDDDPVTGAFAPGASWSCANNSAPIAATCGRSFGFGDITGLSVNLPVGGSVIVRIVPIASGPNAEPFVMNAASITAPADRTDPVPSNNTATDIDGSGVFANGLE